MRAGSAARAHPPRRDWTRLDPVVRLAAAMALAGCASRSLDVRPIRAHPSQELPHEDVLVDIQHGVRTTVRYVRPRELDEAFQPAGTAPGETGNPFLYRPPLAPDRFSVFRIELRNESEHDVLVDFSKILLRDWTGAEYRPLDRKTLTDYWVGKVTIELGKPRTWTRQMEAIQRREAKEKYVEETIFEGGHIPARGGRAGYLAFRGLPREIPPERPGWYGTAGFLVGAGAGVAASAGWASATGASDATGLRAALFGAAGALVGRWVGLKLAPRRDPTLNRLQLMVEVVTRTSRYGNPLNVTLMEFNFYQVMAPDAPPDAEEIEQWRNPAPGR